MDIKDGNVSKPGPVKSRACVTPGSCQIPVRGEHQNALFAWDLGSRLSTSRLHGRPAAPVFGHARPAAWGHATAVGFLRLESMYTVEYMYIYICM